MDQSRKLFIFGGYSGAQARPNCSPERGGAGERGVEGGCALCGLTGWRPWQSLSDVNVLDTESLMWSQPMTFGTPPPPLSTHSCTVVGSRLYVFGGMTVRPDEQGASFIEYSADVQACAHVAAPAPPATACAPRLRTSHTCAAAPLCRCSTARP